MKRILSVTLVLMLVLTLAACATKKANTPLSGNDVVGTQASALVQETAPETSSVAPETKPAETKPTEPAPTNALNLTKEEAKTIALTHAKLTASEVRELEAEKDTQKGKTVYEVSFTADGYEYEYTISGETGEVLHQEKERD